jgi:translation initiation factor 2 beta subunit (eIF-2beta)/eIF-5
VKKIIKIYTFFNVKCYKKENPEKKLKRKRMKHEQRKKCGFSRPYRPILHAWVCGAR